MVRVEVSEVVRGVALAQGPEGEAWLAGLDATVAEIVGRWDLTLGAQMEGGTASWVTEVTRADGTPAVLKLALPLGEFGDLEHEARVLELADGRGCVRLFDQDLPVGALLLERLGGLLHDQGLPTHEQIDAICDAVGLLWTAPVAGVDFPGLTAKGPWLAERTEQWWEELGHPCSRDVIDRALAYIERRLAADDPSRAVLLHGDAHPWNTLVDPVHGGHRLIDPDGLLGDPEYDLAIIMREMTDELVAGDALALGLARARYLADRTGLDIDRIWEWGYVERVSTGLLCLVDGMDVVGRDFLTVAEAWAAAPD
jgi:streptomycin 6-kinase